MKGIPWEVAEHKLNIKPGSKPMNQRLHRFNDDKCKAVGEEILRLLSLGFICEVYHHEWLANSLLVKKKNKKWRMCVDYTSLNKACPKDPFPLPRIDQVVDSTAGCETLCFLDAYSGYHQIAMYIVDQLATWFITPFDMYCYQTMPFGLKNAGATFQRCMRRVFWELIGRIIEVYVDNIVVKSKKTGDLVSDLTEVFAKLRQYRVKLNPEKCIFGVPRGMLLGFVVSERSIEANPEEISTIMDMRPIKNLKGVQCVTGYLAALSRFIARLGECSLPLYKLMKKSDHFTWTPEAQKALNSLKNILKSPPILTAPTTEEPMLLYISTTTQVVSAALVVEWDEPGRSQKIQRPLYFVSDVLSGSNTCYSQMEKLVYAILMTKLKLRHYFDAHLITVVSKYPLGEVIQNPEAEGRIAKWALELMGQNITYAPRRAIKSQVLADFVAEWTEMQTPPAKIEHETWIMYFGDSVVKEEAGVGLVFISPLGMRMEYMVRLHLPASNNAAEYEVLINSLQIAVELGIKRLEIRGDSELVVGQVMKDKNCVDPKMVAYCYVVQDLEGKFHVLDLHHVLCDYNKAADVLAIVASSRSSVPHDVFASDQHQPSVRQEGEKPPEESGLEVMAIDEPPEVNLEDPDCRFPILEWLVEKKLHSDQIEARRIALRAKAFVLIDGELYKHGAASILMRCIPGDQGHELLRQIHAGTCGHLLTVKIRQPSHEFTFGVGMTFVSYPLVLTPVV
jgi:ribonuclease HI